MDQDGLELGGAAVSLRARGYGWHVVTAALGHISVNRVRAAAMSHRLWLEARGEGAGGAQAATAAD